jgi:hypothetical protein
MNNIEFLRGNHLFESNDIKSFQHANSSLSHYFIKKIERIWESIKSLLGCVKYVASFLLHRILQGDPHTVSFSTLKVDESLSPSFDAFLNFDVYSKILTDKPPLTPSQKERGELLLQKKHQKAPLIEALLQKLKRKTFCRADFSADDWRALNCIDFELTASHFENCVELFNSPFFKEHIQEFQTKFDEDFREAWIAEVLAKSIAPLVNFDGYEISLPVSDEGGVYSLVPFTISQRYVGDELPFYLLESPIPNVRPRIVIRGTDAVTPLDHDGTPFKKGAKESLMVDVIDFGGIAREPILKALHHRYDARETLTELMKRFHKEGSEPILIGHSLGGYLAADIAVHFPHHIHKVYSFSAPGVHVEMGKKWKNLAEDIQNKIVHFDTEGDLIPSAGPAVIGKHIAVKTLKKPLIDAPPHYHVILNLNRSCTFQFIDNEKEEKRKARKLAESGRKIGGLVMRWHLRGNPQYVPDWHRRKDVYHLSVV